MSDIIKNSIYLGLGIAAASKEKIEGFVDEMIKEGEVSKEEKSKVVKEILNTLEKREVELKSKTKAFINEAMSDYKSAAQKDIKKLKKLVAELEKKNISKAKKYSEK